MTTRQLRIEMKKIDPNIRVSGGGTCLAIRNVKQAAPVRAALRDLGLVIASSDVEGGRRSWTYVFWVA